MKTPRYRLDSIKLIAETAGISEPSTEVASALSEEVTFRLIQIISKALKFMSHANRTRLTCSDINKALKWSECQPVFGHQCNPNQRLRYSYSAEAQVFRYEDDIVDLVNQSKQNPLDDLNLVPDQRLEAVPQLTLEEEK